MNTFLRWIAYSLIIVFVAWIVPGISVANFFSALLVCVILAIINLLVKPILEFISLPINILTFGLFSIVINALMLLLAGKITPGFQVEGFLAAFLGSIVLALMSLFIERVEAKSAD